VETSQIVLVYVTYPSLGVAEEAAREAVESRLAACVNILPAMRSVYRWQGAIETADEVVALFKTPRRHAAALIEAVARRHPYETPAILQLPLDHVATAYAQWLVGETG
jgi:periplasmic divalent cation tolerance protein